MTINNKNNGLKGWHLILIIGCAFTGGAFIEHNRLLDKPAQLQVRESWIENCADQPSGQFVKDGTFQPNAYVLKYERCASAYDKSH